VTVAAGVITFITVLTGGNGFTNQATVVFSGGAGANAIAKTVMDSRFCCFPSSGDAAPFSVSVTAPRFNNGSATVLSYDCAGGTTTTVALTAATGYVCCGICWKPIPTTLYISDGVGTYALTWDGVISWKSATFQDNQTVTDGVATHRCTSTTVGATSLFYAVDCRPLTSTVDVFRLNEQWSVYPCNQDAPVTTTNCYYMPAGTAGELNAQAIIDEKTPVCTDPFTLAFNVADDARFNAGNLAPCGDNGLLPPRQGPWTVTE
jgi:hypothetical protein